MSRLQLSEWASIAEVIGAAAVVLSLVYVGLEINENTAEVREANRQQLVNRSFNATGRVATFTELAEAHHKVATGKELGGREAVQYAFFVRGLLYDIQEAYLLRREERLGDEYWNTRQAIFTAYMRNEIARTVYRRDSAMGVLQPQFVEWANRQLASMED